jgi:hypothetical protein
MTAEAKWRALADYHRREVKAITARWTEDVTKAGGKAPESLLPPAATKGLPRAVAIAPLAVTKGYSELNILRSITRDADALGAIMDEATWIRIAMLHSDDARLDQQSVGLIRRQMHTLWETDGSRLTDRAPEVKLSKLLNNFQQSIALDTVRNEYMLHTKLHAWLAVGSSGKVVETFNGRVYAELFLTPKSDQWLGLYSDDNYMGLEGGGVER